VSWFIDSPLIKSLLEQLVLVSDSPLEGSYYGEEVSHRGKSRFSIQWDPSPREINVSIAVEEAVLRMQRIFIKPLILNV
jgi:hypothetical protein